MNAERLISEPKILQNYLVSWVKKGFADWCHFCESFHSVQLNDSFRVRRTLFPPKCSFIMWMEACKIIYFSHSKSSSSDWMNHSTHWFTWTAEWDANESQSWPEWFTDSSHGSVGLHTAENMTFTTDMFWKLWQI